MVKGERDMTVIHPAMRLLEPFQSERAIDLTAFIGQWPFRLAVRAEASDLSAMADRLNLSGLCVSHIASIFGFDTRSGNEALLRETEGDDRLWPYAILNPVEAGWERELDWAVAAGARGIRIVPGYHAYSLASPEAGELVDAVRAAKLPLHVCVRLEDERLVHRLQTVAPVPFDEIAELLRLTGDMPVVLSGLRAREWDTIESMLNADHATDRVLLDLWFTNGPIAAIAQLEARGTVSRLAYGSCVPIQVPEATALQLASANVSADSRTALCRRNAASLLGLDSLSR